MHHLIVETELWYRQETADADSEARLPKYYWSNENTPTVALKAILNLPPNYLEVKRKAANDAYELDTIGAWKGFQSCRQGSIWTFDETWRTSGGSDAQQSYGLQIRLQKDILRRNHQKRNMVNKGHESFRITNLITPSHGKGIERRGFLGKSDYGTGSTSRPNDDHIPRRGMRHFIGIMINGDTTGIWSRPVLLGNSRHTGFAPRSTNSISLKAV